MKTLEAPSSAFASYASKDMDIVAQKLSALAIHSPTLDIFQDCLDLKMNEEFKPNLEREIGARGVFWLFWSRNAAASRWVKWEYTTALAVKPKKPIEAMPLEDPTIAPLPPEFVDIQTRDRYLLAAYGLKKIKEIAAENNPPPA
jgi:TIR domain